MNLIQRYLRDKSNRLGFLIGIVITEALFALYLYLRQFFIDQPGVTVLVWVIVYSAFILSLYYFISTRLRDIGHPSWWGVFLILIGFNTYSNFEGLILFLITAGYGYLLLRPGKNKIKLEF